MNEYAPWVAIAIAAAGFIFTVISSRSKKHEETFTEIRRSITVVSNDQVAARQALDGRIDEVEDRTARLEGDVAHLPDKEVTHRLELAIARLEGQLGTMSERMKPIGAMADRIQDAVLARVESHVA